ncbi:MAG: oligosaccharide flippase family protein [Phycisphaerales bacterium]|nr:oligosaccharide flippase family protein [Phycisphaerales bacterium]
MATNILLARMLSPHDFGLMQAAFLALGAMEAISFLATDQAIVHNERGRSLRFLQTVFWVAFVRGVLIAALLVLLAPISASFFGHPAEVALFGVIALHPLLTGLASPRAQVLVKELNFKVWSLYRLAATVIGLVVSIALAIALQNAWALVIGQLSIQLAITILSYIVAPMKPGFVFDGPSWRAIRVYGLSAAGTPFILFLIASAATILLGRMVGLGVLGIFALHQRLARLPVEIALNAVGTVAMPAYRKLTHDRDRLKAAWLKSFRGVCLLSAPLCAALIFVDAELGVLLYGEPYRADPMVFALLALSSTLTMLLAVMGPLFWAVGRPSLDRACQIPRLAVIYGLGFWLVLKFGALGMAYATAAAMIPALCLGAYFLRKEIRVSLAELLGEAWDVCAAACFGLACMYIVNHLMGLEGIHVIALAAIVSTPVFAFSAWQLGRLVSLRTMLAARRGMVAE